MKTNYTMTLMCPRCGNRMKYHTDSQILSKKRKVCVYCNSSFSVKDHMI